jgi:antirestriction protein ArdC
MKTERFDIHQHITDQIVSATERGAGEFRLPWRRSAGSRGYTVATNSCAAPTGFMAVQAAVQKTEAYKLKAFYFS